MIDLTIPIFSNSGVKYTQINDEIPDGGTISNTADGMKTGNQYQAMLGWIMGVAKSVVSADGKEVSDPRKVEDLIRKLRYKAAEDFMVQNIKTLHDNHDLEGVYPCPRCKHELICERKIDPKTGEENTMASNHDTLDSLDRVFYEDDEPWTFDVDLKHPHKIETATAVAAKEKSSEIWKECHQLTFSGGPTLDDLIQVYSKHGRSINEVRFQELCYARRLTHVNGEELDKKSKMAYANKIMRKTKLDDQGRIYAEGRRFGLNSMLPKNCPNCGKQWLAHSNPMNFFNSALDMLSV